MMSIEATAPMTSAIAEINSHPSKGEKHSPLTDSGLNTVRSPQLGNSHDNHDYELVAALGLEDSSQEPEDAELVTAYTQEMDENQSPLRVRFRSNQDTGRVAISVINADTEEVIREIPSEEILRISEKLKNNVGLIFDLSL